MKLIKFNLFIAMMIIAISITACGKSSEEAIENADSTSQQTEIAPEVEAVPAPNWDAVITDYENAVNELIAAKKASKNEADWSAIAKKVADLDAQLVATTDLTAEQKDKWAKAQAQCQATK